MRGTTGLLAFAATLSSASAAYQGFNYGSTFTTGAAKQVSDFEAEFKNAQNLVGAPGGGFTSARLYTTIQAGTANDPSAAIQAAINTKTSLLLGIWASSGQATIDSELAAIQSAMSQFGSDFTSLVVGISVGSEDLYRITATAAANGNTDPGAGPTTLVSYIKQVRSAIASTSLSSAPVGHVDTWTAWVNGSNDAVIDNCDFIGVDAYPYFQNTMDNAISNNKALFNDAVSAVQAAVGGKSIWITETGYPVSGKTAGLAVPSLANAKTYWDEVGCPMFGQTNVWWYTMQDAEPTTPNPSFGIVGQDLTTTPLFDISCSNVDTSSSSSSSPTSTSKASSSGSGSSAAASTSSSGGSGTTSVTVPTSLAGGSPGIGSGLPGSQSSLEASATNTVSSAAAGTTSTVSAGSGSNSTSTSSRGSPTPSASTSATVVPGSGAATVSGSVSAGFLALLGAIMLL